MATMILLGLTIDTENLALSTKERMALSVLSTAIIVGECVCGGTWEMIEDDDGVPHPHMAHLQNCPGTSKTGQEAVRKVIRHVIYQTLSDDTEG